MVNQLGGYGRVPQIVNQLQVTLKNILPETDVSPQNPEEQPMRTVSPLREFSTAPGRHGELESFLRLSLQARKPLFAALKYRDHILSRTLSGREQVDHAHLAIKGVFPAE